MIGVEGKNFAKVAGGLLVFPLVEVGQTKIETNTGNRGGKFFGPFQHPYRIVRLARMQVDDAQIGVHRSGVYPQTEQVVEVFFRSRILLSRESFLALGKDCLNLAWWNRLRGQRQATEHAK